MKNILLVIVLVSFISEMNAQDFKFGKVSKQELQETFYPLDSAANAAYLYKKRNTTFRYVQDKGFMVETEIQERIKIYNSEGFDWGTLEIDLYQSGGDDEKVSGLKAITYSLKNGKIIKTNLEKNDIFSEERNKYWKEKKFTMPNLSDGCVVEWKYKLTSPFRTIDDIQFQYEIPVKKTVVSIGIPEYYVYKKKAKGYIFVTPKTEKKRGQITINSKDRSGGEGNQGVVRTSFSQHKIDYSILKDSYDLDNVPALIEEPYVNNIENYLTGMEYELTSVKWPNEPIKYYSNTWEDVTKTIYRDSDFSNQIYKSNHFDDDLEAILSTAKTDSDKLVLIFDFVKQKIKWNNFYGYTSDNGTRKAYKEGVGNAADINLNLVSMLNYAGLKANPVLVSTRSNGMPIFPTISGFNFVIAGVEMGNGVVLLDATSEYSSPNIMPLRNLNWKGRMISENGSSAEIDLIPTKHSGTSASIMININEDGEVEGFFRKSYTNLEALKYRNKYANVKDEDIVIKIENENNGVEIDDFKIINKKDSYKPVTESCKFYSEDMLDVVGNKMYIKPLLFNSLGSNPFKLDKRDYPIDYGTPILEKNTIQITIPDGYKVTSFPENFGIGLSDNYGVYIFKVSVNGNKLSVQSQLKINSAIIPSQNYAELKDFYSQIVNKNAEFIVLEKTITTL